MTIEELQQRLEEYRAELGGHIEVRLMTQQNWPFENRIAGLAATFEIHEADEDDEDFDPDGEQPDVLYIVEGGQLGYGTKRAWDAAY